LEDSRYWRHQSNGLAVFLSKSQFRHYRLPTSFKELVVVTDRYHLKPLIPFVTEDRGFFVLALSQNEVRFLECTRQKVQRIPLRGIPKSILEATKIDLAEKELQFHTGTPSRRGKRDAIFHGTGAGDLDTKRMILRYLQQIDEGLRKLLYNRQVPLVVAAVDYLIPIYREATTYRGLVREGVSGNPERVSNIELRDRALDILQPYFQETRNTMKQKYLELAGSGSTRASSDLKEIVSAAYHSRIDTLFVAIGVNQWGRFDHESNRVDLHSTQEPGDRDLLDLAVVQTLLRGGKVFTSAPHGMPGKSIVAAIFRF
jgi:hypothetical protein